MKKPRIRAIWLGKKLQELRSRAGVAGKDVAAHVYRDPSSISRIEDGLIPVSEAILEGYMEMCGVTDPHERADLMVIRRDAAQSGWWDGYKSDVASSLMDRAWIESKAESIRTVEVTCLPGLLQTPAYAQAVMRTIDYGFPEADLARWLELRMTRQHVITRHQPVQFQVLIDEYVLKRVAGGTDVMREQLNYLAEAGSKSNIEIRVLPGGVFHEVTGAFEIFDLQDPYPEVAYVATPAGDLCVEGDDVEKLTQRYDRLLDAALDPVASKELIIAERDKL